MKITIQILILLFTINLFAQTKIKFEPKIKKSNISYIVPYLLDENNIIYGIGSKDENGFYNLENLKLDSLKTFRLFLDNPWFLKINEKLNLRNNEKLLIILEPNPKCNCETIPNDILIMRCPRYSFGLYNPKVPRNLNELPVKISTKVENYIKSRVGNKFYKNVHFKQGQIIDSIPYKKENEYSKMKTRYHYYLCFAYSNIKKGIGEYTTNIELDEFGNIIKDIDFPKKNSEINKFVPLSKIKKKAIAKKFYINEKTKTEMSFDVNKNILIWRFINEDYKPNGLYIQSELTYNAHNGKYLELKEIEGSWEE